MENKNLPCLPQNEHSGKRIVAKPGTNCSQVFGLRGFMS